MTLSVVKRFDVCTEETMLMYKIPNQIGYLVLNEEGAVISSDGELENDEKTAEVIMGLITLTSQIDPVAFPNNEGFKKISLTYSDYCYSICLSNRKIYIVKRHFPPPGTVREESVSVVA